MKKIIVVVTNENECAKLLQDAANNMNVEIKYEIQGNGKIENKLSINDIKESTAVLFAADCEVEEIEDIERFIDCEYYEVEPKFVIENAKNVLLEIASDIN